MEPETRIVRTDDILNIEAYHFKGIMQRFPNHFHEHYVVGFVESGRRLLVCKNKEYTIGAGDLLLFNPQDAHTCEQADGKTLDWRCLNIGTEVMQRMCEEITGVAAAPVFTTTVAAKSDALPLLRELHAGILNGNHAWDKEENFYFLIGQLISDYTKPGPEAPLQADRGMQAACEYMQSHYAETVTLTDLSRIVGKGKYSLLRSFTIQKGITPYQYLQVIRINHAKRLLETGMPPVETAAETGFADQSHFTRFFKAFVGLTPGRYQNLFTGGAKQ